jgi:CubicO group peptidase (beta-lactamase class C family)
MKELYDANIFGPLGMKDTQFPLNQEIQGPVLHAFTTDRKYYEDCTYWNPFWGFDAGVAHVQPSRPWQVGSDPGDWAFDVAGALPGADRSDLGGQWP